MSHGTFIDELFTTFGEKFVPVSYVAQRIIGYIDTSEYYGHICSAIAAEIDYERREVGLYFIPNRNKPVSLMTGTELVSGDGFLVLNYNEIDWADVIVEQLGTFEGLRTKANENEARRVENERIWRREKEAWLRRRHAMRSIERSRRTRKARKTRKV